MTTEQQAFVLFLSDELLKGIWVPNMQQNEAALRARAARELRRLHAQTQALIVENETLHAENETLRAGYDAARLEIVSLRASYDAALDEIASLQARVQELGKAARDVNSRRVQELEAQLAAVGAGGVEPLRKRECLHQISPEHSILGIFLSAMSDQLKIDGPAMRDAMLWYCGVQEIATEPQPAAQALDALKKAGSIAVSAVKTNSRDIADWRDDMDRIAAIAAKQGAKP